MCAFLSLGLSHCSKDLKQWTSVIALLQLKLLLNRQQNIHTPLRGEGRQTLKNWPQPVLAPPIYAFCLLPQSLIGVALCKVGLVQAIHQEGGVFFFPLEVPTPVLGFFLCSLFLRLFPFFVCLLAVNF